MGGEEDRPLINKTVVVSGEEELENKLDVAAVSGQERNSKSSVEVEHLGVVGERVAEDCHIFCDILFLGGKGSSSDSFLGNKMVLRAGVQEAAAVLVRGVTGRDYSRKARVLLVSPRNS